MSRNKKIESEWRIIQASDTMPNINELTLNDISDSAQESESVNETLSPAWTKKTVYNRSAFADAADALHDMYAYDGIDDTLYTKYIKHARSAIDEGIMQEARKLSWKKLDRMYAYHTKGGGEFIRILRDGLSGDCKSLDMSLDVNISIPCNHAIVHDDKDYTASGRAARMTDKELQEYVYDPKDHVKATTKTKARRKWNDVISDSYDVVTEAYISLYESINNGMSYHAARKTCFRAIQRYVRSWDSIEHNTVYLTYVDKNGDEKDMRVGTAYDVYNVIEKDDINSLISQFGLTPRESEIVHYMVFRHMTPDRIAAALNCSITTVYAHTRAIRQKCKSWGDYFEISSHDIKPIWQDEYIACMAVRARMIKSCDAAYLAIHRASAH